MHIYHFGFIHQNPFSYLELLTHLIISCSIFLLNSPKLSKCCLNKQEVYNLGPGSLNDKWGMSILVYWKPPGKVRSCLAKIYHDYPWSYIQEIYIRHVDCSNFENIFYVPLQPIFLKDQFPRISLINTIERSFADNKQNIHTAY